MSKRPTVKTAKGAAASAGAGKAQKTSAAATKAQSAKAASLAPKASTPKKAKVAAKALPVATLKVSPKATEKSAKSAKVAPVAKSSVLARAKDGAIVASKHTTLGERAVPVAKAKTNGRTQVNSTAALKSEPVATPEKPRRPMTRAAEKAPDKKITAARAASSNIVLEPDYRPSEDEPFMNEKHRMYFRHKLVTWKDEIIRQTRETLAGLHEDSTQHADLADRATSETDRALELRARDRQRKLIAKIDAALARIEDGSYGYCEETGEPIGLKRLDARPIATLSLEAQERHERRERVYRED